MREGGDTVDRAARAAEAGRDRDPVEVLAHRGQGRVGVLDDLGQVATRVLAVGDDPAPGLLEGDVAVLVEVALARDRAGAVVSGADRGERRRDAFRAQRVLDE